MLPSSAFNSMHFCVLEMHIRLCKLHTPNFQEVFKKPFRKECNAYGCVCIHAPKAFTDSLGKSPHLLIFEVFHVFAPANITLFLWWQSKFWLLETCCLKLKDTHLKLILISALKEGWDKIEYKRFSDREQTKQNKKKKKKEPRKTID